MAVLTVKHAFVSGKPPGPNPGLVQGPHWDADHVVTGVGLLPVGTIVDFAGYWPPAGWLECAGQLVSASAYPELFDALVRMSTVTITIATPGVVTWPDHALWPFAPIFLGTTGALPTPLAINTRYYVSANGYAAGSFRLQATINGADIATSGSQSGIHTAIYAPWLTSPDMSQFYVPDLRDVVTGGLSNMAGSGLSGRLPAHQLGEIFGAEKTALLIENMPAHNHGGLTGTENANHTHAVSGTISGATGFTDLSHNHLINFEEWHSAQGGGGHHVLQPNEEGSAGGTDTHTTEVASMNHQHSVSGSFSGNTGIESATHRHGITSQGSGTGHSNVQPTTLLRKIIFAGR